MGGLVVGNRLIAPQHTSIPRPSSPFTDVQFDSLSGAKIRGWYGRHENPRAGVVLMHGVRGNRTQMHQRAEFLLRHQLDVLLFDFQAHGESSGTAITFGHLESRDAEAAFQYLRQRTPDMPIGALGFSMGGAAALLSNLPRKLDFLIVEATYSTLEAAVDNRLVRRFGQAGTFLAPLLEWPLQWRLNMSARDLQPVVGARELKCPLLVIGGSDDLSTTPADTKELFRAAPEPKSLWIIEGAGHEDFHAYARERYERRVLDFIQEAIPTMGNHSAKG